jgi:predicted flavoprotein YhiN
MRVHARRALPSSFDAVVTVAGAAGLFCAGMPASGPEGAAGGPREKVAEKIRISGGGRCNFTNRDLDPRAPHKHFLGDNPTSAAPRWRATRRRTSSRSCKSTASRSTRSTRASLFGDRSSDEFIRMLQAECAAGGVTHWQPCSVREIAADGAGYVLQTSRGTVQAAAS